MTGLAAAELRAGGDDVGTVAPGKGAHHTQVTLREPPAVGFRAAGVKGVPGVEGRIDEIHDDVPRDRQASDQPRVLHQIMAAERARGDDCLAHRLPVNLGRRWDASESNTQGPILHPTLVAVADAGSRERRQVGLPRGVDEGGGMDAVRSSMVSYDDRFNLALNRPHVSDQAVEAYDHSRATAEIVKDDFEALWVEDDRHGREPGGPSHSTCLLKVSNHLLGDPVNHGTAAGVLIEAAESHDISQGRCTAQTSSLLDQQRTSPSACSSNRGRHSCRSATGDHHVEMILVASARLAHHDVADARDTPADSPIARCQVVPSVTPGRRASIDAVAEVEGAAVKECLTWSPTPTTGGPCLLALIDLTSRNARGGEMAGLPPASINSERRSAGGRPMPIVARPIPWRYGECRGGVMELRQLRYFTIAYLHGSISRAADALFLSQPALSRQIAELERELGVPLFERRPTGVSPTLAGIAMFRHAKVVLQLVDSSVEVARTAGPTRQVVEVGLAPGLPDTWVTGLVNHIRDSVEEVALTLADTASMQQFRRLRDGSLDLAIAHQTPPPGLVGNLLRKDPFGVAVAATQSIAVGPSIRWSTLDGVAVLVHSRDQVSATHDQLRDAAEVSGAHPTWRFANFTENASACALAAGAEAALLTRSSATRLLPGWAWRVLVNPSVELETWLARRSSDRAVVDDVARAIISFAELHRSAPESPQV